MSVRRIAILATLGLLALAPRSPAVGPLQYFTVAPCRLLDTRGPIGPTGGPALSSSATRNFAAYGSNSNVQCGIPTTAKAATMNITVVSPSNCGVLIVWQRAAAPNPPPLVSNINFNAGETAIANGAVVGLGQFSDYQFSAQVGICTGTGTAHLIADITGYYQ
jgi:hypothetical protein